MGAIADLAVPQGGAIAALPVPGNTVTPENADVSAFQTGAGPFRQGLRSGFNSLGANMNALIGQTGEALGLTEFARDRFKDAANYVDFADRVGSPVRDWGQVKDAATLAKFVAGMTGEALASSAPAVGASLALRRPVAGITAGTLPFSAGQQIQKERANPKEGDTPRSVLEHGLEKGIVDSALYSSIGGAGQGVRKIFNPKAATKGGIGSALAEGALGNAAAGGISEVASDKIAGDEPNWNQALNAAISNAVPGAILAGAGHAVGALPGAAARSTEELRTRLGKKAAPADINAEPKIEDLNENTSVDEIAAMLGDNYDKGMEGLHNIWDKVKNRPEAQKFKDYATNEETRQNFNDEIQKAYKESTFKHKIDDAITTGRNWLAAGQKVIDEKFNKKDDTKKSEMRTKVDDDIHDAMLAAMPIDHLEAASSQQLLELGGIIKQMAMNPDYFAETGVPHGLKKAFGPAFKGLMDIAVDKVHGPETRKAAKQKINDVFEQHDSMEGLQTEQVQNLVRTHLKPDYLAKPDMRDATIDELGPKLLDYVQREGKTAPAAQFHDAMKEAFGDKSDAVLAGLDKMHEEAHPNRAFDEVPDPRLSAVYHDVDKAEAVRDDLIKEYGAKNVTVTKVVDPKTHAITLDLKHLDHVGLDKEAFARVRESLKTNRTGVENGVLTVKTDVHPGGAKVSISKLTGEMMRRDTGRPNEVSAQYVADMFKQGIASLMATDGFRGFTDKGGLAEGSFPDKTPVAYMRGHEYTYGEIKNAGKVSKMDLAEFTAQDVRDRMENIRKTPAGRGADESQLRAKAINELMERRHELGMRKTLADRMEMESEEQMVESAPTLRDRDPKDKQGETVPRTYEQDTGEEIGSSTAPVTKVGSETPAPSKEPHGKGAVSPEGQKAADETKRIQDALNSANPKLAKLEDIQKELHKPISKFSLMDPAANDDGKVVAGSFSSTKSRESQADFTKRAEALEKDNALYTEAMNYVEQRMKSAEGRADANWNKRDMFELMEKYLSPKVGAEEAKRIVAGADPISKYSLMNPKEDAIRREESRAFTERYISRLPVAEQKRMRAFLEANKLSDVEAVLGHKPMNEADRKAFRDKLLSTMNVREGPQTEEMRQAVREQVKKVLGPDTEVIFEKLAHAGEFAKLNDVETMKISIDASDPMSVGHHESVHALMGRLMKADPKAAHTLLRAADAAPVVARLHELLADHPDALKQLKDPEERLAYMYQFWATGHKGLMSVGPNTRTFFEKVKGFLSKISAVWSDDMGSALAVERANNLFTAFYNGEFADRNAVGEVLARRFPPDPESQLRTFWPGLGRFMDKAIYTAGGAVRDMNIPAFNEIMDKFHTVQGDINKPTGFSQVRHVMYDQYMNRVTDALKGLTDEQKKALTEELQGDGPRTTPAAKAIEQINKELYQYMVDKGVGTWNAKTKEYDPIREIADNYWHRMPNQDYLRSDQGREAFINMLTKHGIENPNSVWEKWSRDADSGKPEEGDAILGLAFYTPQIAERKLQNIPNSDIAPFLDKDVFGVMHQYVQRAVRRAEYTERFGNRGELIEAARKQGLKSGATPEQMKIFEASVQAHEGTLGADIPIKLRSTYAAVMTYQNLRLLPLQIFSSFVDPLGIVVRGGTVKDAMTGLVRGFRELIGVKQDEHFDLAKTMGTISSALDNSIASSLANAHYMPKAARWVNEKFFKYNGMESWNRSQRIVATVAAHDFIVRHVENPGKNSARFLAELNLDPKKVKVTDGMLDSNDKAVRAAINQWVDESILRPTAAHRPIYMSDPHWMLVSHLKQYSYLFQKVILSRVYNELKHQNYTPAVALAGYVPTIIAADMARMMITPTPYDNAAKDAWGPMDWLWSGIQRAGIFGPGQMAIGSAMDARQDRIPGQNLFGPTFEQGISFIKASMQGTGVSNQIANAIPGLKLIKGSARETLPVGDE